VAGLVGKLGTCGTIRAPMYAAYILLRLKGTALKVALEV